MLRGREGAAIRAIAVGATAVGAASLGALSVGALAIGALAVGRFRARDVRIGRLRVDSLSVGPELGERAGIASCLSHHSINETIERLQAMFAEKGLTLFALVDHSGEAEKIGMKLRPTKLLVFGSPRSGTPLMAASRTVALDLPLKLLVWEDEDGRVWLSFNSADYLRERHRLPRELTQSIASVSRLAQAAGD